METALTTCSTHQVKFNAPWHDLRHAWVGASYGPDFYEPVKNHRVRDGLQKIARETEEDYANLVEVLTQLGVYVQRPVVDTTKTIMDYIDCNSGRLTYQSVGSYTLIPKPPMQPRDCHLIVDQQLLLTNQQAHSFEHLVAQLATQPVTSCIEFDAPLATVVGDTIIVDCRQDPELHDFFCQQYPKHHIKPVFIGGHNDAVFSLIKPGVVVSTYHHDNYADTLPGWSVKFIENQSWNAIPGWRKIKHSNQGRWWVPDSDNNPEFNSFVDSWLGHWLGYVAETVFDVNMLQINERVVLVNNFNADMFDFFRLHKIEPIVTPFRHRFFWDGGIHCITSDIYREGEAETYVPHAR